MIKNTSSNVRTHPVPATLSPVIVEIVKPKDGSLVTEGEPVLLRASASKGSEDLSSEVRWRSNLDGLLGSGRTVRPELSAGAHTLTASILPPVSKKPVRATIQVTTRKPIISPICKPGDDT